MTDLDPSARLLREIFLAGFMSGLPAANVAWAAARFARTMEDVRLAAGELLYRQGALSVEHFFIVEGEVKLEAEGVPTWIFSDRALIGTIDLMLDRTRSRTATATRKTHLLRMSARDWLDMLEDNFELTRSAVQGLADGVADLRASSGAAALPWPSVPARAAAMRRLGLIDRIFALRGIALFASADVQALINLAILADEVSFRPGEQVVEPDGRNDFMFVVLSGEIAASRSPLARDERFGPGQLLFGSTAISASQGEQRARAATSARALRLAREDYFDVMEEHFQLARSAFKALSAEREVLVNEKGRRAAALHAGEGKRRARPA